MNLSQLPSILIIAVVLITSCTNEDRAPRSKAILPIGPHSKVSSKNQARPAGAAASNSRDRGRERKNNSACYSIPGLWKKPILTWRLEVTADFPKALQRDQVEKAIAQSFASWQPAGVFTFVRSSDGESADITVSFGSPKEAMFDSMQNRVAYSFYPWSMKPGRIYLDPRDRWSTSQFSLVGEPITDWLPHEIGHALGLTHCKRPGRLMHPVGPFPKPGGSEFRELRKRYAESNLQTEDASAAARTP